MRSRALMLAAATCALALPVQSVLAQTAPNQTAPTTMPGQSGSGMTSGMTGRNAPGTMGQMQTAPGQAGQTAATPAPAAQGTSAYGAQPGTAGAAGQEPGAPGQATATADATATFRPLSPAPGADIITALQQSGEFTTLLKVADATGLTQVIKTRPNLTLLAPTDAAFSQLPASELDLKDQANLQKLQQLLAYHLINAKVPPVKGHASTPVPTVAGKTVTFNGLGDQVKINDATALQPQVQASNGVIYPIDKVLSPDYTPPPEPAADEAPSASADTAATSNTTSTTTTSTKKSTRHRSH